MTIQATDVLGLKVLTLDSGAEIGKVHDVVYDPMENRVKALLIEEGGWLSGAKVILMEDVKNIGQDAVIVQDEMAIKKASEIQERIANIAERGANLIKTKIVTENGKELGHVTDIFFEPMSGRVNEFEVSGNILENIKSGKKRVGVSDIITIGEDATIVREFTEMDLEQQARRQGLQGAVSEGVAKVEGEVPKMKQRAKGYVSSAQSMAREKTSEIKSNPKVQNVVTSLKEKIGEAKDIARAKWEEAKEGFEIEAEKAKDRLEELSEKAKDERVSYRTGRIVNEVRRGVEGMSEDVGRKAKQATKKAKTKIGQYKASFQQGYRDRAYTHEVRSTKKRNSRKSKR